MLLYIKNMVCDRCKMVVGIELESLGFKVKSINLGEVEILKDPTEAEKILLGNKLREFGFELMDDKNSRMIEKIKNLIVELVHYPEEKIKINLSEYLESQLHKDHTCNT